MVRLSPDCTSLYSLRPAKCKPGRDLLLWKPDTYWGLVGKKEIYYIGSYSDYIGNLYRAHIGIIFPDSLVSPSKDSGSKQRGAISPSSSGFQCSLHPKILDFPYPVPWHLREVSP